MSQIKVGDVHVDQVLTNLSIGYHPFGMVAERVAKVVPVKKESDKYYIWNRDTAFRVDSTGSMSLRADGTESKEIDFGLSTATYSAEEYALKALITDRQKDNADDILKLRESKMRRLQDLILLEQEIRVATLLTTAGNWDAANTSTPGVKWDAAASVTIEKNIDDAKEVVRAAIGLEPNTIVIPAPIAKVAKRDSSIRELIKYTQNDLLVNGDLPPTMFGMNVIIPGATYATAAEGASSQTYSSVYGESVILLYVSPEPVIDAPDSVKIFRSQEFLTRAWREEKLRGEYIEPSLIQDEVITSNISGYLYTSVLT